MGWRFRKAFNFGPFRQTLSQKGWGWSIGIRGFRYGIGATGRRFISFGIPGTGIYYLKYLDEAKNENVSSVPLSPKAKAPKIVRVKPLPNANEPWWKQKDLFE